MLATIKGYDSFNKEVATEIADKIGKSPRSVIAKIKSMGLSYTVQRPVRKDGSPVSRKADTVAAIAKALDMELEDLDGLAKAPRSALIALLREIP
jgi:broad specificity phosphatase PhoE